MKWRFFLVAAMVALPGVLSGNASAADPVVIDSIPAITWEKTASDRSSPDAGQAFSRLIQEDWQRSDRTDGTAEGWLRPARRHLEAAKNLLDVLRDDLAVDLVQKEEQELARLEERLTAAEASPSASEAEQLYAEIRGQKRRIVFSNPLYQGYELLFCKQAPGGYSHLVAQYLGWRARSGGGLFVLEQPGLSLQCRDLTGKTMPVGSFQEPRLSFDGKKIAFSFVNKEDGKTFDPLQVHFSDPDEGFYHVWTMNVDGSDPKQITSGSWDDLMPNWLPDGDLVFSSTRRKGYARCFWWGFGRRWNTFTIHRMKPDGSGIHMLSCNDTSEWFPFVAHDGTIFYTRWDYIDRDAVTHQNLWSMRPDGTNPKAVWGNATPSPHCVFQGRPVPGSNKILFTAAAHHSITGGSLVLLDPAAGVDGSQALQRVTPEVPFPETEGWGLPEYYASPFPLSEEFFFASYSPEPLVMEAGTNPENALGIYALDVFGNRELVYRDPVISSLCAAPIREEEAPPILQSTLPAHPDPFGEMTIDNVYEGLGPNVEPGSIKELRVVQIFPKTTRDLPPVGLGGEENARAILGTVPVESDGSAFFRVPAMTPILLQCLDGQGRAYQTMRSLTYLQPGERVSCVGCHENRASAAYASSASAMPSTPSGGPGTAPVRSLALAREPSTIEPGSLGGRPFSFMETIQPILDSKCLSCHNDERTDGNINLSGARQDPGLKTGLNMFQEGTFDVVDAPSDVFSKSYYALCEGLIFYNDDGRDPERAARALVPRFGGRNTIQMTEPGGRYGAIGSRLMKILLAGHEGVTLTDEELRCFYAWIDLNAIFYGVYDPEEQEKQMSGQRVPMPDIL